MECDSGNGKNTDEQSILPVENVDLTSNNRVLLRIITMVIKPETG